MKLLLLLCFLLEAVTCLSPQAGGAMMNMAMITDLDVICDKAGMTVTIDFSQPFNGIIFSKGYYSDPACRYVEHNSARSSYGFRISLDTCGTAVEEGDDVSLFNTIVIQFDPLVQEVWDTARRISCSWRNNYSKQVNFKPLSIAMLDVVRSDFKGEPLKCWMDIRRGIYPNTRPLEGVLPIGEDVSVMVFLEDKEKRMDVGVRDCWALPSDDFDDRNLPRVQLTSFDGCPLKEKLMGNWQSRYEESGAGSTLVTYSKLSAFKFPDYPQIYLTCNVEICQNECEKTCVSRPTRPTTEVQPYTTPRTELAKLECYPGSPDPACREKSAENWCKTRKNHPKCKKKEQPGLPRCIENPNDPRCLTERTPKCENGSTDPKCRGQFISIDNCYPDSTDPACNKETPKSNCYPGINDPACRPEIIPLNCNPGSPDPLCLKPKTSDEFTCKPGSSDVRCRPPEPTVVDCSTNPFSPECAVEKEPSVIPFDCSKKSTDSRCRQSINIIKCEPGSEDLSCVETIEPKIPETSILDKTSCRPNSNDPGCSGVNVFKIPAYSLVVPDTPLQVLCPPGSTDPICKVQEQKISCILNPELPDCIPVVTQSSFTKPEGCYIGSKNPECTKAHRESTFLTKPTERPFTYATTTPQAPVQVKCIPGITSPNCPQLVPLTIKKLICSPGTTDPRCPEYTQVPQIPIPEIIETLEQQCLPDSKDSRCNLPKVPKRPQEIDLCLENPNDPLCENESYCKRNPSDLRCSKLTEPQPPLPVTVAPVGPIPPRLHPQTPFPPRSFPSIPLFTTPTYRIPQEPFLLSTLAPKIPFSPPPVTEVTAVITSRPQITQPRPFVPKFKAPTFPSTTEKLKVERPPIYTPPRESTILTTPSSRIPSTTLPTRSRQPTSQSTTTTYRPLKTAPVYLPPVTTPISVFTVGTLPPARIEPPRKAVPPKITPVFPPTFPPAPAPPPIIVDVSPRCEVGSTDPKCVRDDIRLDCSLNPLNPRCTAPDECPPGSKRPECISRLPEPHVTCENNPNNPLCQKVKKPIEMNIDVLDKPRDPSQPLSCSENPQDSRCKERVYPKRPIEPHPIVPSLSQRPTEKCANPNEPGCGPPVDHRRPCSPGSTDSGCAIDLKTTQTVVPELPKQFRPPQKIKEKTQIKENHPPPVFPPIIPPLTVEPDIPFNKENLIPTRPSVLRPSTTPKYEIEAPTIPVEPIRPSSVPKVPLVPEGADKISPDRSTSRPQITQRPSQPKKVVPPARPTYAQTPPSVPVFPPKFPSRPRPSLPSSKITPSRFGSRTTTAKPVEIPDFPPFPIEPYTPLEVIIDERPVAPVVIPEKQPRPQRPEDTEKIHQFKESGELPPSPKKPSVPFFSVASKPTTQKYERPTSWRPINKVPVTTSRVPSSSTQRYLRSTTSATPTVSRRYPTTTQSTPDFSRRPLTSRRRPQPPRKKESEEVTEQRPHKFPPESLPVPVTKRPQPILQREESRPITSDTKKAKPKPRPKEMMHGKDDFHGKGMDPRYHAFHSYLFQPLPRPRKRSRRGLPDSSILVTVGGKKLTVVASQDGEEASTFSNIERGTPYIVEKDGALVIPDKTGVPFHTYLLSDAESLVEEVPINDDYDFITYSSSEIQTSIKNLDNEFDEPTTISENNIPAGSFNFVLGLTTLVIIFITVMVVVISSRKRKRNKEDTLEL
ncbi:titin [Hyalella azteca]|uniref:Titin n=1 Tax=Hyalella azteca TaxID=294128 RepID=A0A8B7PPN5_HYAAZ|nr:titin [Hyalella azteca]XP_018027407.1 titin [Hyalella azteca]